MRDTSADHAIGYLAGAAALVTGLTYLVLSGDSETIFFLAGREQVLESIGACLFFLCAVFSLAAYVRARRVSHSPGLGRKHIYILLSIFFIVAFGEEISWGQNIFNFLTPSQIAEINQQKEFNIHNLNIFDAYRSDGTRKRGIAALLTANRFFDYFMITAFIIIPAAYRRMESFRRWLTTREIPVLPWVFSLALVFNYVLTAVSEALLDGGMFLHGAVSEVREFNYAYLCLTAILHLYLKEGRVTKEL